jgi:peptidoglycan/LPS O-acetylase OafA/YrhL
VNRAPGILIAGLAAVGICIMMLIPNVDMIGASTLLVYPVAATICGAALWASINSRTISRFLSQRWLVFLGKISFGLYVFHFYAMWLTDSLFQHMPSLYPFAYLSRIAIALAITVGLSASSYFLFERYFLRLKIRFSAVENRPV